MLIAATSQSGDRVDQHFGHANRFLIYDYAGGTPRLLREVSVDKYCSSDPDHSFHEERFASITDKLSGCKALVTEMIGDLPRRTLTETGIVPVVTSAALGDALKLAHDFVCGQNCRKESPGEGCPHH